MFFIFSIVQLIGLCDKYRVTEIEWLCISVLATSLDSSLSLGSGSSANLLSTALCEKENKIDYNGLDFRIILDSKSGSGPSVTVILVASTLQEKAAWCSDIGQVSTVILFSYYHSIISCRKLQNDRKAHNIILLIIEPHNVYSCTKTYKDHLWILQKKNV